MEYSWIMFVGVLLLAIATANCKTIEREFVSPNDWPETSTASSLLTVDNSDYEGAYDDQQLYDSVDDDVDQPDKRVETTSGDVIVSQRYVRSHPAHRHHRNYNRVVSETAEGYDQQPHKPTIDDEDMDRANEPTCEELKTIWKLTKQAAIRSLSHNEIPTFHTGTFGHFVDSTDKTYGQLVLQQPVKSSSNYVHGRKVYHPDDKPFGRFGTADTLRARTAGSYDKVEEQLRRGLFSNKPFRLGHKGRQSARRRDEYGDDEPGDEVVYGTYKSNSGLTVNDKHRQRSQLNNANDRQRHDKLPKWSDELTRQPKVEHFLDEYDRTVNEETTGTGFVSDSTGCKNTASRKCHSSIDCSCFYGLYKCIGGKCKKFKSKNHLKIVAADVASTFKNGVTSGSGEVETVKNNVNKLGKIAIWPKVQ